MTVNDEPWLSTPLAWTTTFPLVAPAGTVTPMLPAFQLVTAATVPLNLTVLVPCVAPKAAPAIVTEAPTAPDGGVRLVMLGVASTVKLTALLLTPLAWTTTVPVVAPAGTAATRLVALHVVMVAVVPLNLSVLVPCVAPKAVPAIVTEAPTASDEGVSVVMLGVASTVKLTALLSTPLAWTTTVPVAAPAGTAATILVALHVVMVAVVPLNLTVLVPCVAPKAVPAIVTEAPTAADAGVIVVMLGLARTEKAFPVLATPATVTTTFPLVAPTGTTATMLVALHVVTVAVVVLNLTVLVPWVDPNAVPAIVTEAPTAPDVGVRLEIVGAAAATEGSAIRNSQRTID
jgi:hypothetical protein